MAPSKLDWCQPGPVALPGHRPAAAVAAPDEVVPVGPGVSRRQPKAGAKAKAVAAAARAASVTVSAAGKGAGKGSGKGRGRPKRCCVETAAEILEEYMGCTPNGDYFGSNPNPRRQLVAARRSSWSCRRS